MVCENALFTGFVSGMASGLPKFQTQQMDVDIELVHSCRGVLCPAADGFRLSEARAWFETYVVEGQDAQYTFPVDFAFKVCTPLPSSTCVGHFSS